MVVGGDLQKAPEFGQKLLGLQPIRLSMG